MSNFVKLDSCEFRNPATREITFGFKMCDDYTMCYNDSLDEPILNDMPLLTFAISDLSEDAKEMLVNVINGTKGISINGTFYDGEEISELLAKSG